MKNEKHRCLWVDVKDNLSCDYHDNEWGVPIYDDNKLFEALVLESAQAGLSWNTILQKRENYRKAFSNFIIEKVAKYDKDKVEILMQDCGIVRHRLKIESAIVNAKVILVIKKEFGSFSNYIWHFTEGNIIENNYEENFIPSKSSLSDKVSKDMKKRGMKFIGTTTIYSFLQAIGVINDHSKTCFCSKNSKK